MKFKIYIIGVICFFAARMFPQGLLNNGARIVFSGASRIYIDGTTGHYTSQAGGLITPSATSSITLLGNWINNSSNVAFSTDGGGVLLAGAAENIGGSNATAFNNLTLAGSGVKTLAVNQTTVGGQSVFSGIFDLSSLTLDLSSNTLNVTNSAVGAITRTSGFIISETNSASNPSFIKWFHRTVGGVKVYPFGVAGTYIPFTLNITAPMLAATDFVEVSTRATPSDNTPWASGVTHMYSPNVPYADGTIPAVIDRWWQINNSSAVTANTTFSYRGTENTLNALYNTGMLGAQYWAAAWLPDNANLGNGIAVSVGVGNVVVSGLNNFGPMVLTSQLSPLPVELINFDAACFNKNSISVNWCTATELNNEFFTLERSNDGINFLPIKNIPGAGTTGEKHCYSATVNSDNLEQNYFRLKQTDFNHQSKFSPIILAAACGEQNASIVITNNGTKEVGINYVSSVDQNLQVMVHNTLGQLIEIKNISAAKGTNALALTLENVGEAFYYVSVYNANERLATKKIVISEIMR